ncbi:LysM peptidoglycan-binding domain-containing protein [Ornithinibacillus californiensis]|uniref:LysM peptidoglycan-binding domain-containing protein n=1 Tax=Ornithinibacillus californiensis TaxID=161536 RepID=UPI00069EBF3F|nr:LysM peptidoglycan-binding domain-containing protein [Ornithinibacillus californiensis]
MGPFTRYKINETENGIEVILYIDENLTEFSSELGTVTKEDETNIEKEAEGFVKRMFPSLKVKSVKIMAGAMLLTSFGMGVLPTTQASAAEAKTTQSQTVSSTYIVSPGDTLYSIAKKNGTTVDAIKQINQLSSDILNIGQKLIIPNGVTTAPAQTITTSYTVVSGDTLYSIAKQNGTTVDAIKQASNLTSNTLSIGQRLTIPSGSISAPAAPTQTTSYTVISGDTLYSIANQSGTTVDAIKQANNLTSNTLSIGQTLTIPTGNVTAPVQSNATYKVISGDTLYSIANQSGTTIDAIKQANNLSSDTLSIGQTLTIPSGSTSAPAQAQTTSYTVVSGDTLFSIAQKSGTTVDAIRQASNLTSNTLSIGQTLTIPSGSIATTPTDTSITAEQQSEVNQEDVEWLAKMIYSEGRGESIEGQIAIGAVIMNRVNSPLFPNTIKEVLFEKSYGYYQFTPAETGVIHTAEPNGQNYEAAERALNGEDPTNGALFFYNPDKASSSYLGSRVVSTTIGNHVFSF